METSIISPPSSGYLVLTSELYSIQASTDQSKILVEVERDPDGEHDLIFSTELYAYNDIVTLSDIGSLIEEHFVKHELIWADVEIRFDGVATRFTALYCRHALNPGFNYTAHFLCATSSSVVHRNSAISLAHWSNGTTTYNLSIVGLDANGNAMTVERSFSRTPSANHVSFAVSDVIDLAKNGSNIARVSYFKVSYGSMSKTFFVANHAFYLTFGFRNMFNAYEYLDVVGTVKRKTEYERGMAICSAVAVQYDHSMEQSYEVQTGPLTEDQVKELEQLIGSRSVRLCASGSDYDVVITEQTVEADNNDESLSTVKFTFRFSKDRPLSIFSDLGSLVPSYPRVFSQAFSAVFE